MKGERKDEGWREGTKTGGEGHNLEGRGGDANSVGRAGGEGLGGDREERRSLRKRRRMGDRGRKGGEGGTTMVMKRRNTREDKQQQTLGFLQKLFHITTLH